MANNKVPWIAKAFLTLVCVLVAGILLGMAFGAGISIGSRKARAHDNYTHWVMRSGASCCSETDCYATPARFDTTLDQWWARRREDGKWLLIPKEAYDPALDQPGDRRAPQDGQAHLCAPKPSEIPEYNNRVYCLTPGQGI